MLKHSFAIAAVLFLTASAAFAATCGERYLDPDWVLKQIANSQKVPPSVAQLRHGIQTDGINAASFNPDVLRNHNDSYTLLALHGPVTNQRKSGRCYAFGGFEAVTSFLIAQGKLPADFEASENHFYYFHLLEKANRFVDDVIQSFEDGKVTRNELKPNVQDGSFFQGFAFIVQKYGMVPKSAMPETAESSNSADMIANINKRLGRYVTLITKEVGRFGHKKSKKLTNVELETLLQIKKRAMEDVIAMLTAHLGAPPKTFEYRESGEPVVKGKSVRVPTRVRTFTPLGFMKEIVQFNPDDYVSVASNPLRAYGKVYQLQEADDVVASPDVINPARRYLNVNMGTMKRITLQSLRGGQPVWFGADVSEQSDIEPDRGILNTDLYLFNDVYGFKSRSKPFGMNRKEAMFLQLIDPNHAMLIVGADQPKARGPVVKWLVQNSWGKLLGENGFLHMYDNWYEQYVFEIVVRKDSLTPKQLKLLDDKPIPLTGDFY